MSAHPTATDGVWRVMRFETASGKWAEVASNQVGPEVLPIPPGYKFVSSTPMVSQARLDEAEEALREIAGYSEHGRHSAITPATLAGVAQRALDALAEGGTDER